MESNRSICPGTYKPGYRYTDGNVVNDAEAQVNSTLITIMGRISAYTGKDVTWDELLNSDLFLGPKTYAFGPVPEVTEIIPVIGSEPR